MLTVHLIVYTSHHPKPNKSKMKHNFQIVFVMLVSTIPILVEPLSVEHVGGTQMKHSTRKGRGIWAAIGPTIAGVFADKLLGGGGGGDSISPQNTDFMNYILAENTRLKGQMDAEALQRLTMDYMAKIDQKRTTENAQLMHILSQLLEAIQQLVLKENKTQTSTEEQENVENDDEEHYDDEHADTDEVYYYANYEDLPAIY